MRHQRGRQRKRSSGGKGVPDRRLRRAVPGRTNLSQRSVGTVLMCLVCNLTQGLFAKIDCFSSTRINIGIYLAARRFTKRKSMAATSSFSAMIRRKWQLMQRRKMGHLGDLSTIHLSLQTLL